MAKSENNKRLLGVKPTSYAMVVGTYWSIVGLGVAILNSIKSTVEMSAATDSVLAGLTFGVAAGVVSLVVIPFVYFAMGWLIGVVQGFVLNYIVRNSGGVVITLEDNKE